jgi:hypothetical protein
MQTFTPKYPTVKVGINLEGPDGNAFVILGRVKKALEIANVPEEEIKEFMAEATSGDYESLLRTCASWVSFRAL